jgi:V8-like Glu-specific endopeptidase
MRLKSALFAVSALTLVVPGVARADEGMWTFDAFPAARMKQAYGFAPDQAWLDRTRAAAVRLTGGCSASFVSDAGLILTNHHCVATCVEENSTAADNILKTGFTARTTTEEKKCAGQQAEVVTAISDVTPQIKAAIGSLTGEAAVRARTAATAKLEADSCTDKATTRCQVVSLYGGGQYKLHTYRKYSDVRLVWAPEAQAAQFGGDPDNFNFPRFSMDASFLRAYENGKPVATPAFLKWNPRAPQDGEATFVVGNPGSTQRLMTSDQLAFQREVALPITLATQSELRGRLISAMKQSPERAREAAETLGGLENSLKVTIGRVKALNDPAFTGRLAAAEADLKRRSAGNAAIGNPWADIAAATQAQRNSHIERSFATPSSQLFSYALALVRAAEERGKPNAERLPGFSDSALPLLEKSVTDERPITPWIEQLRMEWSLSKAREYLGADHPQTRLLLGKESPEAMSERLVSGTRLADASVRKALWQGGAAAVAASTDPMIVYARSLDANARALQKRFDAEVDAPTTAARARLADARFAAFGDSNYPDATFTLRISYGKVQGWNENGRAVPTRTTLGGTFDRATGAEPFDLPAAFVSNQAKIDKNAVYNFVTTNDIIGGNSGSPVIDRAGTVIGAAFDGNIHSLGGNYGYDGTLNRTVVVSTAAVQEALETIYPAPNLVAELNRGNRRR